MEQKSRDGVDNFWSEQHKEDVIRTIGKLEQLDNIRMFTELLHPYK